MFLQGFFSDTLPTAPVKQIAVLRCDGDTFESTWDALTACYNKVSRGGFIIIDDYNSLSECRKAVDQFREEVFFCRCRCFVFVYFLVRHMIMARFISGVSNCLLVCCCRCVCVCVDEAMTCAYMYFARPLQNNITAKMTEIDRLAVYWQKA